MIPIHLQSLVATFRPQRENETDREYLRAALSNAQNTALVSLEHLVKNLVETLADSAARHNLR